MYTLIKKYIERDLILKYNNNIFITNPLVTINLITKPFILSNFISINVYFFFIQNLLLNFELNNTKSNINKLNATIPLNQILNKFKEPYHMVGITTNTNLFSYFTFLNTFKLNNITTLSLNTFFNYKLNIINVKKSNIQLIYSKLNLYNSKLR